MKKLLISACMLFGLSAFAQEWYEGGTLHSKTMKEWNAASYRDRLATAADFTVTSLEKKGLNVSVMDWDDLKEKARAVKVCLDNANSNGVMNNEKVAAVAAMACLK